MGYEYYELSVSETSSTQSFTTTKQVVVLHNNGLQTCYFNVGVDATTNNYFLLGGESKKLRLLSISDIRAVCDTGLTTTLEIEGWGE